MLNQQQLLHNHVPHVNLIAQINVLDRVQVVAEVVEVVRDIATEVVILIALPAADVVDRVAVNAQAIAKVNAKTDVIHTALHAPGVAQHAKIGVLEDVIQHVKVAVTLIARHVLDVVQRVGVDAKVAVILHVLMTVKLDVRHVLDVVQRVAVDAKVAVIQRARMDVVANVKMAVNPHALQRAEDVPVVPVVLVIVAAPVMVVAIADAKQVVDLFLDVIRAVPPIVVLIVLRDAQVVVRDVEVVVTQILLVKVIKHLAQREL